MSDGDDRTSASRAVVEQYIARLVAGGNDANELIAEEAEWWVAGNWQGSGSFRKAEVASIAEASAAWFDAPLRFSIRSMIADGDKVAVELRSDGRFRTGEPYANDYVMIYQVRGGKIVSVREYLDTRQIAEGLDRLGETHPAVAIKTARRPDSNRK